MRHTCRVADHTAARCTAAQSISAFSTDLWPGTLRTILGVRSRPSGPRCRKAPRGRGRHRLVTPIDWKPAGVYVEARLVVVAVATRWQYLLIGSQSYPVI